MAPSEYKISKGRNYMNKKKEISDLEYSALQETKNMELVGMSH